MADGGHGQGSQKTAGRYLAFMCLAALGVVYGDIGTSPLYALRESFGEAYGVAPTEAVDQHPLPYRAGRDAILAAGLARARALAEARPSRGRGPARSF